MVTTSEKEKLPPIIIKKVKKGGGDGHHGGAWKVAYADFVTAMMAFFLLLWLLNVSTDEQKQAISNYFNPTHPTIADTRSGSGGLLGGMSLAPDGALVTNVQQITRPMMHETTAKTIEDLDSETPTDEAETEDENPYNLDEDFELKITDKEEGIVGTEEPEDANDNETEESPEITKLEETADASKISEKAIKEEIEKRETEMFEKAEEELRQAMQSFPELQELAENLIIDQTPEGLRVQIVDQEGKSMFPLGSAQMFDKTTELMQIVSDVMKKLPNKISIRGHTDSVQYRADAEYTNWELSTDRANASRRTMLETGLPAKRIENVVGKADSDHLIPEDPKSPQNRRISIILLRESLAPYSKTDPIADKIREE